MKKIIYFFIIQTLIYPVTFLNRDFSAYITEKSEKYKKEYILEYTPDTIKLIIQYPKVNKGEIYTYNNNKKTIYYPILDDVVEQDFVNEDIDFFTILNKAKNVDKTQIIDGKKFVVKDDMLLKIIAKEYEVVFEYNENKMPIKTIFESENYDKVEFQWKY